MVSAPVDYSWVVGVATASAHCQVARVYGQSIVVDEMRCLMKPFFALISHHPDKAAFKRSVRSCAAYEAPPSCILHPCHPHLLHNTGVVTWCLMS